MQGEQNKPQLTEEETEAISNRQPQVALEIAKEAVKLANIPQQISYKAEFTNPYWYVSYKELNKDIILTIHLQGATKTILDTSLGYIALLILGELELLLSNEKALKLFAAEESEHESEIFRIAVDLTRSYIDYLPLVAYHSFHQALNESLISHIKKIVDYDMRRYLEEIGEPNKKFTLLPNNKLSDIIKLFPDINFELLPFLERKLEEFSVYRKASFGDRQVWLTPETFAELPANYEKLKLQYKEAKKQYKIEYRELRKVNRRSSFEDDWKKHWEEYANKNFPDVVYYDELLNYSAAELAQRQIGEMFGISASYMETLISNAKKQAAEKPQQNQTDNEVL
jgi:hypothetical protein